MNNSTITADDLISTMDKLGPMPARNNPLFPFAEIGGIKIIESRPAPKLKLREAVDVTDEFRHEFNLWLANMFGYQDSLLQKDQVLFMQNLGMAVMRPEQVAMISNICV